VEEYYSEQPLVNKSTIVGHANAEGAIAVGAVLFSNTAPYGNTPSIASFSSTGGTPVFTNGVSTVRQKPEITAPNGVNTSPTVVMGPDRDFVTDPVTEPQMASLTFTAHQPLHHMRLLLQPLVMAARNKFYPQSLTTDQLRTYLFETAKSMQPDGVSGGWNFKAGYGLVQPDAAIRAFANPTPKINALVYDAGIVPGAAPFVLKVTGDYFSANSVIYFRGAAVPTVQLNDSTLQATIPQFSFGTRPINVFTPSFPGATGDGGLSNTLYFFTIAKLRVDIKADNKTKKYGEVLPANSFTIFVEGDSLHVYNQKFSKSLTAENLGLSNVTLRYVDPTVNPLSDVGTYRINATRTFNLSNPADVGLLEVYKYDSLPGNLQITKLPVVLSPKDFTVQYGDALDNFEFNYAFDPSATIADREALTAAIRAAHNAHVDNSVLGIMNA
jgi:hypothetical protein